MEENPHKHSPTPSTTKLGRSPSLLYGEAMCKRTKNPAGGKNWGTQLSKNWTPSPIKLHQLAPTSQSFEWATFEVDHPTPVKLLQLMPCGANCQVLHKSQNQERINDSYCFKALNMGMVVMQQLIIEIEDRWIFTFHKNKIQTMCSMCMYTQRFPAMKGNRFTERTYIFPEHTIV